MQHRLKFEQEFYIKKTKLAREIGLKDRIVLILQMTDQKFSLKFSGFENFQTSAFRLGEDSAGTHAGNHLDRLGRQQLRFVDLER